MDKMDKRWKEQMIFHKHYDVNKVATVVGCRIDCTDLFRGTNDSCCRNTSSMGDSELSSYCLFPSLDYFSGLGRQGKLFGEGTVQMKVSIVCILHPLLSQSYSLAEISERWSCQLYFGGSDFFAAV